MYLFSGGTKVTVIGTYLDSVAEPRINLTVIITRTINNTVLTPTAAYQSQVSK